MTAQVEKSVIDYTEIANFYSRKITPTAWMLRDALRQFRGAAATPAAAAASAGSARSPRPQP
jgi:hypothetical protein